MVDSLLCSGVRPPSRLVVLFEIAGLALIVAGLYEMMSDDGGDETQRPS